MLTHERRIKDKEKERKQKYKGLIFSHEIKVGKLRTKAKIVSARISFPLRSIARLLLRAVAVSCEEIAPNVYKYGLGISAQIVRDKEDEGKKFLFRYRCSSTFVYL